jgi:hypothetical protein
LPATAPTLEWVVELAVLLVAAMEEVSVAVSLVALARPLATSAVDLTTLPVTARPKL